MPPTLHCVRHAEGYHNLTPHNHGIHDPSLTPHGESQCSLLFDNFPYPENSTSTAVVASPLHRTIATALLSFPTLISKAHPLIALPSISETSDLPCDTGSNPEVLAREYGDNPKIDLNLVHEGWNVKQGKYAPTSQALESRAREARQWLRARPEANIIVVTHGGLLHYLTEDWAGSADHEGTGWANCECRSYRFVDDDEDGAQDGNAGIQETVESKRRRRGREKPLTKEEKAQLRETARIEWERQGFQRAAAKV